MKRFALLITTFVTAFLLTACTDACVGPSCSTNTGGTGVDNVIGYVHVNGEGVETEKNAFLLYEFETRDYMKYQITYLSCTCRPAVNNYWNVAYIEINKFTDDVRTISFTSDGDEGHYTAGLWGDSDPVYITEKTLTDFETDYFPWLIGKTSEDLEGISVFTNENYHGVIENTKDIAEQDLIDAYVGSSVSTNNLLRITKELLAYHEDAYER